MIVVRCALLLYLNLALFCVRVAVFFNIGFVFFPLRLPLCIFVFGMHKNEAEVEYGREGKSRVECAFVPKCRDCSLNGRCVANFVSASIRARK